MTWDTSKRPPSSQKLRNKVLAEEPTCYLHYPGCTMHSAVVDHVTPYSQGGTDTRANLAGACKHCHDAKTQAEAKAGRRSRYRTPEKHPGTISR